MQDQLRRLLLSGVITLLLGVQAAPAASYTNTIAHLTTHITTNMAAKQVQGLSIALVDDQRVVWTQGFGWADKEKAIAAAPDTVYHIGSCSKAFLGTLTMQLLDAGRIDLEAPLSTYIPEFSMRPRFTNSEPVIIRSLLNHHSGLPGDFFNGMVTTREDEDMAWLIHYLQSDYPFAPVNQRYYYCNVGFTLMSEAVARIAGTSFAQVADRLIFEPLDMNASSFLFNKAAISNRLAAAYSAAGQRMPPEFLNCQGSGSMYSSVKDLTQYIRMILADGVYQGRTIVNSNGIDIMTTPQLTNLPLNITDFPQGLGWDNADDQRFRYAGKVFWKDGATLCHCAFLGISRDLKLGVAVIQNSPGNWCDELGAEALRWAIRDKTGLPWPSNTFVPPFAPITNRSQAELDVLAGIYVVDEGYHLVEAQPGSLTLKANAHTPTPTITSNLVPRANGCFSPADSQDAQFAFTNLDGHAMLIYYSVNGAYAAREPIGEHYVPGQLPVAWVARTNKIYRMIDMHPYDYFWEPDQAMPKTLRLQIQNGALLTAWMLGAQVMQPINAQLAWPRGVHHRRGGALQVSITNLVAAADAAAPAAQAEVLQYSSYRFIDETTIPTLPVSTITNGAISFANGTQWYWFTARAGKTYRLRLTSPGQQPLLRITDREGITLASGRNGLATLTCASNATLAIAVSATHPLPFTLSLTVAGSRQSQLDYDGDGKADPVIYDVESGILTAFLSGSAYAPAGVIMSMDKLSAGLQPIPGDFDGDGKADPALYDPQLGLWGVRLSSQAYALAVMAIGDASCQPVAGDFDGDGKADPALYSPTKGLMGAWLSGANYAAAIIPLGGVDALNASEDYDGDGLTDPAVFHVTSGELWVLLSSRSYAAERLKLPAAVPDLQTAVGDYDGDGKADPTLFQAMSGLWLWALSGQGYAQTVLGGGWAGATLLARPGDYDGDGLTDPAIYIPEAKVFYAWLSGSAYTPAQLRW